MEGGLKKDRKKNRIRMIQRPVFIIVAYAKVYTHTLIR